MIVDRQELLTSLESVQPGLSKREIIEQSSCFVFKDGRVMTFNDEIACSFDTSLNISGAVQAEPLLGILRKLTTTEIDFTVTEGELRYRSKRCQGGVRMDNEVLLPIDSIELPGDKKWRDLSMEFSEAVSLVEKCAGSDESYFSNVCVHIHPEWVEACDMVQVARYRVKTGVKEPILVRRNSIKHIYPLGMRSICETGGWLHFKNPAGLVLSCRRNSKNELDPGSVIDFTKILEVEGTSASLPKGLVEAAEKAEIFSQENSDGNYVKVELRPGKLRLTGRGVSGWYQETKDVHYEGQPLAFLVDPKLLSEITKEHNECQITPDRLKVGSEKFVYVTVLMGNEE